MTQDENDKIEVARALCQSDLWFFTRYFYKSRFKRKLSQWDHLKQISDVLERVIRGEITRLIINVAPRLGKTEIAVKNFIAHGLAINPAALFIHLSYADALALDNSETVRDLVMSEEYQQLFPDVKVKRSSFGKKKWYTEAGGGVYATSAGGQVTGFGAGRVDMEEADMNAMLAELSDLDEKSRQRAMFAGAIIIDDPIKPEDSDSDTKRNRVNDRFDSTISNRVNSRTTPIVIIMQRVHEMDLAGYVVSKYGKAEDGGDWHILSLPSIKEDGSALCPERFSIEELRKLEKANEIIFQRQHMQNPKPKAGLLFPSEELHYFTYDPHKEYEYVYLAADPANLGGDDFASVVCKLSGNWIDVVDVVYNTKGADLNEEAIVRKIIDHKVNDAGIEGVMGWKESVARIREQVQRFAPDCTIRSLHPRTAKHPRIVARSSFIKNHFRFRDDWQENSEYAKFMRNLTSYLRIQAVGMQNKHDDAPDVCEMAAGYFEANFPQLWVIDIKE